MNPKNLIRERLAAWWLETVLKVSGWFMTVNFTKVAAVITVSCFLLTSVMGHAVSAVLETARETKQFNLAMENFAVPHTLGRITDGRYFGSDQVVINIQDLHCHAEVQRNIDKILSLLDEKYKLKEVFLEGAWKDVDTSWLADIKSKKIKQRLIDSLTDQGVLTGAEYYSASSGKTSLIKGLENEGLYFANFKRLNEIIKNQPEIKYVLGQVGKDIDQLKDTYYNRDQKQLENTEKRYKEGKMEAKKYYKLLDKFAEKLGVDIYGYRNIIGYVNLIDREKKLDYKRVASELQQFVTIIKQKLPYGSYKELLEKTDNFSKIEKAYTYLQNLAKEYNISIVHSLPELNAFFEYIDASRNVNPIELVGEEKRLVGVLEQKLGANLSQKEVAFMVDFYSYFEDFLENKISADDYDYFVANSAKFKMLWTKYIDSYKMSMLSTYLELCDAFYKANLQRNDYFIKRILGTSPKVSYNPEFNSPYMTDTEKTTLCLAKAKNIKIVVTGGFHTTGLSKLLEKQKVSYLVITPNVTQDTKVSQQLYDKVCQDDARILFQAFGAANIRNMIERGKTDPIAWEQLITYIMKGVKIPDEQLEAINETANGIIADINKDVKFEVLQPDKSKKTYIFTLTLYGAEFARGTADIVGGETRIVTEAEQKAQKFSKENRLEMKEKAKFSTQIFGLLAAGFSGFPAISPILIIPFVTAFTSVLFFFFLGAFSIMLIAYFGYSSQAQAIRAAAEMKALKEVTTPAQVFEVLSKAQAGALVKKSDEELKALAIKVASKAAKDRLVSVNSSISGIKGLFTDKKTKEKTYDRVGMHLDPETPSEYDLITITYDDKTGEANIRYTSRDENGQRVRKTVSMLEYEEATGDNIQDLVDICKKGYEYSKLKDRIKGISPAKIPSQYKLVFRVIYNNVREQETLKEITTRGNIIQKIKLHELHHQWLENLTGNIRLDKEDLEGLRKKEKEDFTGKVPAIISKWKWLRDLLITNEEWIVSRFDMLSFFMFTKLNEKEIDTSEIPAQEEQIIRDVKEEFEKELAVKGREFDEEQFYTTQLPFAKELLNDLMAGELATAGGKTLVFAITAILLLNRLEAGQQEELQSFWKDYDVEINQILSIRQTYFPDWFDEDLTVLTNLLEKEGLQDLLPGCLAILGKKRSAEIDRAGEVDAIAEINKTKAEIQAELAKDLQRKAEFETGIAEELKAISEVSKESISAEEKKTETDQHEVYIEQLKIELGRVNKTADQLNARISELNKGLAQHEANISEIDSSIKELKGQLLPSFAESSYQASDAIQTRLINLKNRIDALLLQRDQAEKGISKEEEAMSLIPTKAISAEEKKRELDQHEVNIEQFKIIIERINSTLAALKEESKNPLQIVAALDELVNLVKQIEEFKKYSENPAELFPLTMEDLEALRAVLRKEGKFDRDKLHYIEILTKKPLVLVWFANPELCKSGEEDMHGVYIESGKISACLTTDALGIQRSYIRNLETGKLEEHSRDYVYKNADIIYAYDSENIHDSQRETRRLDDSELALGTRRYWTLIDEIQTVLSNNGMTPYIISGIELPDQNEINLLSEKADETAEDILNPLNKSKNWVDFQNGKYLLTRAGRKYAKENFPADSAFKGFNEALWEEWIENAFAVQTYFKENISFRVNEGRLDVIEEQSKALKPGSVYNIYARHIAAHLRRQGRTVTYIDRMTADQTNMDSFLNDENCAGRSGGAGFVDDKTMADHKMLVKRFVSVKRSY